MNSSREYRAESNSSFVADMRGSPEHDVLRSTNNGAHSPHFSGRSTPINIEIKSSQAPYVTQSPAGNTQPNNDDIGSRSTEVFYPEHTLVRPRRWFSKIHEAFSNGKIGDIRYFLSFGITPLDDSFRYTGYFGNMLLRNLVRCKQSQSLDIILQWFKDHDLSFEKLQLDSLDELARQTDDQCVLDILIHHGADKNKLMQTLDPLHKAVHKKDTCRVLELINHEEGINGKHKFYMLTPLYVALESRNVEIIELFLEVFVESHNINLFPALMYAAKNQDKDLFTRVLGLHNFSEDINDDFLLLLGCTIENDSDTVLELLEKACNRIDHILNHSHTDTEKKQLLNFLHLIFTSQNTECILWLIERIKPGQLINEFSPVTTAASFRWDQENIGVFIIEILRDKGFPIDAVPGKGRHSPLYMATRSNSLTLTEWFLKNKVNPDALSSGNQCPLHIAAELNNIELLKMLIAHGADLEAGLSEKNYSKELCMQPLEIAAAQGNYEVIKILLAKKSPPDPLFHFAAAAGDHRLANWLIENSYRPTRTDKLYRSANTSYRLQNMMASPNEVTAVNDENIAFEYLFYIALDGVLQRPSSVEREDFIKTSTIFFSRLPRLRCASFGNHSPLFWAASETSSDLLQMLLEHQDPNANAEGYATPLFNAVTNGSVESVRLLLDRKADPNALSTGEGTPLHAAAKNGRTDIARLLLERNADPNAFSTGEGTPLHAAAKNRRTNMVRLLLERNADPNACSTGEVTPLHVAASNGHIQIVRLLLKGKADKNALSIGEGTPLHAAAKGGHTEIVMILIANGGLDDSCKGITSPLYEAIKAGHLHTAVELIACRITFKPGENEELQDNMRALEEEFGPSVYGNPLRLRSLTFRLIHEQLTPLNELNPPEKAIDGLKDVLKPLALVNVLKNRYDDAYQQFYI